MKGSYCLMRLCWDGENVLSTPESDGAERWGCNTIQHSETATVVNLTLCIFHHNKPSDQRIRRIAGYQDRVREQHGEDTGEAGPGKRSLSINPQWEPQTPQRQTLASRDT